MAAAVRSTSTLALGTRTNSPLTAPSGIQNGDILLIVMTAGKTGGVTLTAPTGFTTTPGLTGTQFSFSGDPTYLVKLWSFYKVASGESGGYSVSHSSADTEAVMYAISGADGTTPINPTPTAQADTDQLGGNVLVAPSITPTVDDSLVVFFGGTWDAVGNATAPTGTTPTFTERYNPTSGSGLYVADGVLATAGATGSKQITAAQAADRQNSAAMIVVQAAAGGGGGGGTPKRLLALLGVG